MLNDTRNELIIFIENLLLLYSSKHGTDGIDSPIDIGIDAADESDEDNTQHTQDETCALGPVALDGGNHTVVLTQEHRLDYQQVVVQ